MNKNTAAPSKETAATGKAAAELPKKPVRRILNRFRSISAAFGKVPDAVKAAAAVLVLMASTGVLVCETGAFRMFNADNSDRKAVTQRMSDFRTAAGSAVLGRMQTDVSEIFTDAAEYLGKEMEGETVSLRRKFMKILDRGQGDSFCPESESERLLFERVRAERRKELSEDPLLLLVNKWHYLPEDYTADPVTLPNGQMIGSECCEPLMQMLEDCAAAGGNPIVCSGYRPHYKQVDLYNEQTSRWLYAGYGQEDSEDLAATAVAVPGTSEHELGLAADIYSSENMSLDESQVSTFTQQWLMENCWKYGFVLRYPRDKSDITGIIFEPWHYRYVGDEHARKIHEAGICLEEYLDQTDHPEEAEEDTASSGTQAF